MEGLAYREGGRERFEMPRVPEPDAAQKVDNLLTGINVQLNMLYDQSTRVLKPSPDCVTAMEAATALLDAALYSLAASEQAPGSIEFRRHRATVEIHTQSAAEKMCNLCTPACRVRPVNL